jgi:ABC-type dipeptide/oligopeptide/nickel transport system ATPase subunit
VTYFLSGVATAEARATKILTGLGFDEGMILSTPTQALSGGWAMRAALAAALFVTPDMLLLDEVRCVTIVKLEYQKDLLSGTLKTNLVVTDAI